MTQDPSQLQGCSATEHLGVRRELFRGKLYNGRGTTSTAVEGLLVCSPLQCIVLDETVHIADVEIQGRQLIGESPADAALRVLQSLDSLVPRQLNSLLQRLNVRLQECLHTQAMPGMAVRNLF